MGRRSRTSERGAWVGLLASLLIPAVHLGFERKAKAEAPSLELTWNAPAECPSRAWRRVGGHAPRHATSRADALGHRQRPGDRRPLDRGPRISRRRDGKANASRGELRFAGTRSRGARGPDDRSSRPPPTAPADIPLTEPAPLPPRRPPRLPPPPPPPPPPPLQARPEATTAPASPRRGRRCEAGPREGSSRRSSSSAQARAARFFRALRRPPSSELSSRGARSGSISRPRSRHRRARPRARARRWAPICRSSASPFVPAQERGRAGSRSTAASVFVAFGSRVKVQASRKLQADRYIMTVEPGALVRIPGKARRRGARGCSRRSAHATGLRPPPRTGRPSRSSALRP